MIKKINTKLVKLVKYYSLINHNLIYENEAINRNKSNKNLSKNIFLADHQLSHPLVP